MENQVPNAEQTNVVENTTAQDTGAAVVSGQVESSAATEQGKENSVNNVASEQDDATNKRFAEIRRSYEGKLKDAQKNAEKALSDAVKAKEVEMVKALHKSNPWTGEAIEDEYDVEEYLAMQALADKGEDPMTAYHKQIKANKRNAAQAAKEKADSAAQEQSRVRQSIQEFQDKYKDVNVQELLNDEEFRKFGEKALETVSLTKVYEAYLPIKEERARIKAEQERVAAMAANSSVAVGSVTSAADPADSEFFTPEQVRKMSREEISKNYEKIRASQEKW